MSEGFAELAKSRWITMRDLAPAFVVANCDLEAEEQAQ